MMNHHPSEPSRSMAEKRVSQPVHHNLAPMRGKMGFQWLLKVLLPLLQRTGQKTSQRRPYNVHTVLSEAVYHYQMMKRSLLCLHVLHFHPSKTFMEMSGRGLKQSQRRQPQPESGANLSQPEFSQLFKPGILQHRWQSNQHLVMMLQSVPHLLTIASSSSTSRHLQLLWH